MDVDYVTHASPGAFEAPADPQIDATAATAVAWAAPTRRVRLTPAGVTTATHWRATWVGYLT